MNELRFLAERFLAGETTIEEEQRLRSLLCGNDIPSDLLPLREMLKEHTTEDLSDQWLIEDYSEEYNSIVSHRKRKRALVWMGVAAVAVGLMVMVGTLFMGNPSKQNYAASNADTLLYKSSSTKKQIAYKNVIAKETVTKPDGNSERVKTVKASKIIGKSEPTSTIDSAKRETTPAATRADSLEFYLAQLEKELDRVGDSVYESHIERIILTDNRLQGIINRGLLKSMLAKHGNTTMANNE